jgi:ferredoxin
MAKLTFLPENKIVELLPGVTILDTAIENGIDLPSQCEVGICTTCMAYVEKGEEFIVENMGDYMAPITSKNILSCVSELKEDIKDAEIVVNIKGMKF